MMRRVLTAAAATVAAIVLVVPAAWADESITAGAWQGSALSDGPIRVEVSSYPLRGTFQRASVNRQVQIVASADPAGSGACAIAPVTLPTDATPVTFSATLLIPCNGTYTLTATASTTDNAILSPESAVLDRTITVVAPAPTVTGLGATARRRLIDLRWDSATGLAPDLSGYIVQRKIDSGVFTQLDRVGSDEQTFTDTRLPVEGGKATYRVLTTRPSPEGEQVSATGQEASASFPSAPTDSTGGTGSDGSTGGTTGGSTTGGSGTGGSSSTTGTAGGSSATPSGFTSPRLFTGSFLPPLLRPASEVVATPTTADPGYNELLPYGARNAKGDTRARRDEVSSISSSGEQRRGMLIPVAMALVLAIWSFHLRVLARAARPID